MLTGSGFLYNMVRIIAGTLVEVGLGHIAPEEVKNILEAKDRKKAGKTLPAQGLFLMNVEYWLRSEKWEVRGGERKV